MKKVLAAFLSMAVVLSLFSACSGTGEPPLQKSSTAGGDASTESPTPQETFILFTGTKTEAQTEAFIKYIIEPFEAQNPGIKVDWQPTANWDETLKVQMAGGKGPDLMDLNGPTDAIEYYTSGRLLDLTPYVEKYGWNNRFYDWALNVCKTKDGIVTGLPVAYEGMMMWYNKAMFAEKGWEYPTTYEAFADICTKAKKDGLIPVAFGSSGFTRINEWWLSAALSAYTDTKDLNRLLSGEINFQDPVIKGGFEKFVDMWKSGWISNSDSVAVSFDDARSLFTQGMAPFIMEGTWYYQTIASSDMDFGVELIPSLKEGKKQVFPVAVSRIMAVNKDTQHVDAIMKFIDFLINNEEGYINSVVKGNNQPLPINVDLSAHTGEMEAKMAYMTNLMAAAQKDGNTGYCLWTFFPQETRIYLYENLDNVLLDRITLDKYLTDAQEVLNKDIKAGNVPQTK